ncbi:hypothetical protein ACFQHO_04870 [Actinomadura yumaensis]
MRFAFLHRIEGAHARAKRPALARAMAVGPCLALIACAAVGCGGGQDEVRSASPSATTPASPSQSPSSSASPARGSLGLVVKNDCLADRPTWIPVRCDDDRAAAKVVGLGLVSNPTGVGSAFADCPADTDQVLNRPDGGSGYFCLRNLRPPHHARPGSGGGIVVVGDCLTKSSAGYVEVPCRGNGKRPKYKVVDITEAGKGSCPKGNGRVQLSPDRLGLKLYCAERL